MLYYFLFPILFICFSLSASLEQQFFAPTTLSNEAGVSSSLVNGCVNAITGDYLCHQVDVAIPGPEPLILERHYSSGNDSCTQMMTSWEFNQPYHLSMSVGTTGGNDETFTIYHGESTGAYVKYYGKLLKRRKHMEAIPAQPQVGMTNCYASEISARTNLKNNKAYVSPDNKACHVYLGAGGSRGALNFGRRKTNGPFTLNFLEKPTGNRHSFHYDDQYWLEEIKVTNKQGDQVFGKIRFDLFDTKKFFKTMNHGLTTDDGNKIQYHFKEFQYKSKGTKFTRVYLDLVKNPQKPTEEYHYREKAFSQFHYMIKKTIGENRFQEIDYYTIGNHDNNGNLPESSQKVNIKSKSDYRINRVKCLKAPVGTDNGSYVTHRLFYDDGINKTKVFDALDHQMDYYYDNNHLLKEIKRYKKSSAVHSTEGYRWGSDFQLSAKYLVDGSGNALWVNQLTYTPDGSGNLLSNSLYGNITGTATSPLILDANKRAVPTTSECYTTTFAYTNTEKKLLQMELHGNQKKVEYEYEGDTDLVKFSVLSDGQNIRLRNICDYNDQGVLIKKMVDEQIHRNGRLELTERRITKTTPYAEKPSIGLPHIQEQFFEDFKNGQIVFLSKTVNTYTKQRRLETQSYYDNEHGTSPCYVLKWGYDDHGNVIKETNAMGEEILRGFDANDNMVWEIKDGLRTEYKYDLSNRLREVHQQYDDTTTLVTKHTYDLCGNRISTIDAFGHEARFSYDEFGHVIKSEGPFVHDSNGQLICPTSSIEYDVLGNPILVRDANGHETKSTYNIYGKPLSILYPDGTQERFEYELDGSLRKMVAKNGLYTLYKHDILGRLLNKAEYAPDGTLIGSESSHYNSFHLLSHTDPMGHVTNYTYDAAGREIEVVEGNLRTTTEYDSLGRPFKKSQYYGPNDTDVTITIKVYDFLNRILEERVEDHAKSVLRKTEYTHDSNGNRITETKETQAGRATTTYEYDAFKQLKVVKDPLGHKTYYHYNYNHLNSYGQYVLQITETDPLGHQIFTTMDTLNRVSSVSRTNSMGQELSRKENFYDAVGNLLKSVETVFTPDGESHEVITEWKYNSMNEVIKVTEAVGTPLQKETLIHYNEAGQKDYSTKGNGVTIYYTYWDSGLLKTYTTSDNSVNYVYEYDRNGNVTRIKDLIAATENTHAYDVNDRMIQESLGSGITCSYDYDGLGRKTQLLLPNQTSIEYIYDAAYLREVHRMVNGKSIYSHHYTKYDLSGRLEETQLPIQLGKVNFRYDLLGRHREISHEAWTEVIPETGYDAIGNLTCLTIEDSIGKATNHYQYDDLYQITSEAGTFTHTYKNDSIYNRVSKDGQPNEVNALNQLIDDGEYLYDYDGSGNLIRRKSKKDQQQVVYGYDALDRLISVTKSDSKYVYGYDSFNRRLSKTCYTGSGSAWTKLWQENFIYQDQNEIGTIDEEGRIIDLRVLGDGRGAEIGATIALELRRKLYIPLHDHNGHLVSVLDPRGKTVEAYRYSAFGEEEIYGYEGKLSQDSELGNPWHFSSKRLDPETGFIHFGRRYYDPRIGRWLAPDPKGFEAGPNLYAYVTNSPLIHFDSYGLFLENISFASLAMPFSCTIAKTAYDGYREKFGSSQGEGLPKVLYANFENAFFHSTRSSLTDLGIPNKPNCGIGFINGMDTSFEEAKGHTRYLSNLLGGVNIELAYNATAGKFIDLTECCLSMNYCCTEPVEKLHECWNNFFKRSSPDAFYLQFAHSHGSALCRNALLDYPPELRKRIIVVAIAPSGYIYEETCAKLTHYRVSASRDIVPRFDRMGAERVARTIFDLQSHAEAPLHDHEFRSPTYAEAIERDGRNYLKSVKR